METYYKLRVHNVTEKSEEMVSYWAFEFGCSGISEALAFHQADLRYDPKILQADTKILELFFEKRPELTLLSKIQEIDSRLTIDSSQEDHKDWLEEWKKGFHAFQLWRDFWIVPSWEQVPTQAKQAVFIDPGMAFGTGTHATTQMMAALIGSSCTEMIKTNPHLQLLDVGSGTGVLSIMAEKLGCEKIIATDIDPEATRVGTANALKNECSKIEFSEKSLWEIRGTFPIVAANIIDGVLLQLKPELIKHCAPQGKILLSGILSDHEDEFIQEFLKDTNLAVQKRLQKDEWVAFQLQQRE